MFTFRSNKGSSTIGVCSGLLKWRPLPKLEPAQPVRSVVMPLRAIAEEWHGKVSR